MSAATGRHEYAEQDAQHCVSEHRVGLPEVFATILQQIEFFDSPAPPRAQHAMLAKTVSVDVNESCHSMKKNTGLKRIRMAAVYSYRGICAALRHEAAFRQESFLAVGAVMLALWLDVTSVERVILISVTILVMIVELLNSALEAVVDRIGTEHHELSGRAKDMGSGAVLISLILWFYAWADLVLVGRWLSSS